jgi:hypothetical protein
VLKEKNINNLLLYLSMNIMPHQPRLPRSPSDIPTNREILNKIDNDISLLRGEVMEIRELLKILIKEKESSGGWFFSN